MQIASGNATVKRKRRPAGTPGKFRVELGRTHIQ
jgi:hypothetical protein